MARRSGLGRGLGALIPTDITGETGSALREVPVEAIAPNPHQPRSYFDEEALATLTASVAELGVLQPVLVREAGEDRFEPHNENERVGPGVRGIIFNECFRSGNRVSDDG